MFKEIKKEWIQRIRQMERPIIAINYCGWLTNQAMVILIDILKETFDEPLDFNPRRRKAGDMRHPDFDKIHELSNIQRLDPYLPSAEDEYKDLKEENLKPKKAGGGTYTLSDLTFSRGISPERLAIILERDIEETTEPIDLGQFHHEAPPPPKKKREYKPGEKAIDKPIPQAKGDPPNDLPF